MTGVVSAGVAICLTFISLIHVYWAFGGAYGINKAIPKVGDEHAFTPGVWVTLGVACALLLSALLALLLDGAIILPSWASPYLGYVGYLAALVFSLRALGDLNLVGFTKRIGGSEFARWDTWVYSPLCLVLGMSYFYLSYVR